MYRIALAVLAVTALVAVPAGATKKAAPLKISGGTTTLALDPGTATALTKTLGIAVSPLKPARAGASGIAFPITSGRLNAKTLAGSIGHSGGLRFAKGNTVVKLRNFRIRIDDTPDLTAALGSKRVSILNLDLSKATVTKRHRHVTVAGVKATLTKTAADALNAAFKTNALAAGTPVGTATVKARLAGRKHR
jgi:Htaa